MTVGQRIAQKRKELGLSQEALGDKLGVSRQSIYKWESDSALPEVEKLIALAKLFGVSVGWLLGVEEPVPETSGELTETQLNMVEEIVSRYIAAQPKSDPHRGKRFFRRGAVVFAALFCACFFAIFSLFSRLDRMDQQYSSLQNSVNNVTWSVNSQISGISSRVEAILKSQNDLTADYSTEVTSTDYAGNMVTFAFRAIPKTFSEGMTAWLEVQNEGVKFTFGPFEPQGQTFTGEATVALTDDISLYIVFETGGKRETQLLDTYEYLYTDSLPSVSLWDHDLMFAETSGGVLTLSDFYISVQRGDSPAAIADLKVGLFKNQKLLAWGTPCKQPSNFQGFEDRDFYRLPDMTIPLTKEDQLVAAALVTDGYGRQSVISEIPYILDVENQNLTWPEQYETDTDPAHWQFD